MPIEMMPTIDIYSLADALEAQYHWEMDSSELCALLFNDEYNNYSYKSYSFEKDEKYEGYSWQDENKIAQENLVKGFLRDILPNHKRILIDVSW